MTPLELKQLVESGVVVVAEFRQQGRFGIVPRVVERVIGGAFRVTIWENKLWLPVDDSRCKFHVGMKQPERSRGSGWMHAQGPSRYYGYSIPLERFR